MYNKNGIYLNGLLDYESDEANEIPISYFLLIAYFGDNRINRL